jgi:hypothetical protein
MQEVDSVIANEQIINSSVMPDNKMQDNYVG